MALVLMCLSFIIVSCSENNIQDDYKSLNLDSVYNVIIGDTLGISTEGRTLDIEGVRPQHSIIKYGSSNLQIIGISNGYDYISIKDETTGESANIKVNVLNPYLVMSIEKTDVDVTNTDIAYIMIQDSMQTCFALRYLPSIHKFAYKPVAKGVYYLNLTNGQLALNFGIDNNYSLSLFILEGDTSLLKDLNKKQLSVYEKGSSDIKIAMGSTQSICYANISYRVSFINSDLLYGIQTNPTSYGE